MSSHRSYRASNAQRVEGLAALAFEMPWLPWVKR